MEPPWDDEPGTLERRRIAEQYVAKNQPLLSDFVTNTALKCIHHFACYFSALLLAAKCLRLLQRITMHMTGNDLPPLVFNTTIDFGEAEIRAEMVQHIWNRALEEVLNGGLGSDESLD